MSREHCVIHYCIIMHLGMVINQVLLKAMSMCMFRGKIQYFSKFTIDAFQVAKRKSKFFYQWRVQEFEREGPGGRRGSIQNSKH